MLPSALTCSRAVHTLRRRCTMSRVLLSPRPCCDRTGSTTVYWKATCSGRQRSGLSGLCTGTSTE
jgi:hypothetical protein